MEIAMMMPVISDVDGIKEPEKDRRFMPAINDIGSFASHSIVSVEKIPNVENP